MIAVIKEGNRKYEVIHVDLDPVTGVYIEKKTGMTFLKEELEFLPYLPGFEYHDKP